MPYSVRISYDNSAAFHDPYLWVWGDASALIQDVPPTGSDDFGPFYDLVTVRPTFNFRFKEGPGTTGPWEDRSLNRTFRPIEQTEVTVQPDHIWTVSNKDFVYHVRPKVPEAETATAFLSSLQFKAGMYIPETGGLTGLGASLLADGRVVFGLYHPNAARVYVMGTFNDWQRPGHGQPEPDRFIELDLYRGYFGLPNIWLVVVDGPQVGDQYKFVVQGGVPRDEKNRIQQYIVDPYARRLTSDLRFNNPVIEDPTTFQWTDQTWNTPDMAEMILYELSVYGFTEGDSDIDDGNRGKFAGITERIDAGYFSRLGVTALALMPLAEFPNPQAPDALGYNPSLFCTIERDFGTPDDLRRLVDTAHRNGLAVLLDEVFNHTDNHFNPLWQMCLESSKEEGSSDGGLYFSGGTPWGNRVATEKTDVQNLLIDACKLLIREYHVDGFRLDATNTAYMDHRFVLRLAEELHAFKPDVILVAENLPNQGDLNRSGFDGYAQWCDQFHDKIKALLREGPFQGQAYNADNMGDMFFFSRNSFSAHTNNVVNYCESHDEHSVPYEIQFTPVLNNPGAKDRKGRLGLMSAIVALGQPMIYMGQEFNTERPRNLVTVNWPGDLEQHGFFQWASRLINLRKRYSALRLRGYNPAETGQFTWIVAPWLDRRRGGGSLAIGWRSRPTDLARDTIVTLLNFENYALDIDVAFGIPGLWVKLADINRVNDLPPSGSNSIDDPGTLRTQDGNFSRFILPSSSGFVYKWQAPLN